MIINISVHISKDVCYTRVTHIAVILAADGVSVAGGSATDTDDGDRGAREADERIHVLNYDAQGPEDRRDCLAAGLVDGLAALDRARRAGLGRDGGGGGKDCEGREGGELGEHDDEEAKRLRMLRCENDLVSVRWD